MSILVENVSSLTLKHFSAEFCDGNAVFTLAILAQTIALDKLILLERLLDCRPKGTGSFAVDDANLRQIGSHGLVQIPLQYAHRFNGIHAAQINFRRHGGQLHFLTGMLGTGALFFVGILVFLQVHFILGGGHFQNTRL